MNNYINQIYNSSKYGPYKIISIFKDNSRNNMAKIKFIKSEAETLVRLNRALSGNVKDPQYGLNFNKIYYSDNYGPYKIIDIQKGKIKTSPKATIQFLNSNNIYTVLSNHAINGDVSDKKFGVIIPLDTSILNFEDKNMKLQRFSYNVWYSMMKRCYNKSADNYNSYGNLGITVCDKWKLYNNFLNDIKYIPQYEKWCRFPTIYQLDKDYLQLNIPKEQRIYSINTCIFLYYKDNINLKGLEFRKNNNTVSNYYGVHQKSKSTYGVQLIINNKSIYLGTYNDEIVAANVYNYWYEKYHQYELVPLFNDVPFIPATEFIKYNTRPKVMCNIRKDKSL